MPATFKMLFTNINGVPIFFKNTIRDSILEIQGTLNVVRKISVFTNFWNRTAVLNCCLINII